MMIKSRKEYYNDKEINDLIRDLPRSYARTIDEDESFYSIEVLKKGLFILPVIAGLVGLYYLLEYICWTVF